MEGASGQMEQHYMIRESLEQLVVHMSEVTRSNLLK
jgi:hypothetical protein